MISKLDVVKGYNDLIGVGGDIEAATASPAVRTWSKANNARRIAYSPGERKWIF